MYLIVLICRLGMNSIIDITKSERSQSSQKNLFHPQDWKTIETRYKVMFEKIDMFTDLQKSILEIEKVLNCYPYCCFIYLFFYVDFI